MDRRPLVGRRRLPLPAVLVPRDEPRAEPRDLLRVVPRDGAAGDSTSEARVEPRVELRVEVPRVDPRVEVPRVDPRVEVESEVEPRVEPRVEVLVEPNELWELEAVRVEPNVFSELDVVRVELWEGADARVELGPKVDWNVEPRLGELNVEPRVELRSVVGVLRKLSVGLKLGGDGDESQTRGEMAHSTASRLIGVNALPSKPDEINEERASFRIRCPDSSGTPCTCT